MDRAEKGSKTVNSVLSEKYYDPSSAGSFGGVRGLSKAVKGKASVSRVKDWLSGEDTYTLHRPVRRKFPRRKTIVSGPNIQWQADLLDVANLKKHNDGNNFILTAIDVFSKVAYAYPIKNKTAVCVIKALKSAFEKAGLRPALLQTDRGLEFLSASVQKFLKENGIKHFVSLNEDIKAAVVERFNRTLKERIWRYFTKNNTSRYVSALPSIVSSYNRNFHRSIGMSPSQVNSRNQEEVWNRLYGGSSPVTSKKDKTLKVGDIVRISQTRMKFKKGYLPGWSTETFVVTDVLKTSPITYHLRDEAGEDIDGAFYSQEIQRVKAPAADKVYNIERVLKRKGGEVLVRWQGYPEKYDSWIKSKSVVSKRSGRRGRK